MIILFLTQFFVFLILLCTVIFLFISLYDFIQVGVPFVPVRKHALPSIIKALQLSPGSILFDLGCGDGRVLIACVKSVEKISGVGIERGIMPFFISSLRTRGLSIKIEYNDIFKINLAKATHIFCYLSGPAMERLASKFRDECRAGTRIVSCDFPLPNWAPKEVISVAVENDKFARNLFVHVKDSLA